MKDRIIKIILIVIMLMGVAFSISNFISIELNAGAKTSTWVYKNGTWVCMGFGDACDPFAFYPKD